MTEPYRTSMRPPKKEVVVATFDSPHEAELVRVYLASREIESSLKDDTLVGLAQLYSTALGGVKVLVDAEDFEAAEEAIRKYRRADGKRRKRRRRVSEDDIARRAFRAAIIGIFVCPGAFHVYAIWLVTTLRANRLTKSGRRSAIAAVVVSALALLAMVVAVFAS